MNKLPDTITITITPEDAEKAAPYYDRHSCLLGAAIQRELGIDPDQVSCGGTSVRLGSVGSGDNYRLDGIGADLVCNSYQNPHGKPVVTEPFQVTLTLS